MLLRLWRRRECLTLRAAAGRVGIHPSTFARVEQGEQMHGETLAQLLLWVLGREERPQNETLALEAENTAEAAPQDAAECSTERFEKVEGLAQAPEPSGNPGEFEAGQLVRNAYQFPAPAPPIPAEESASEARRAVETEIAEEPEAGAELPVHALDQDPAVCDLRPAGS